MDRNVPQALSLAAGLCLLAPPKSWAEADLSTQWARDIFPIVENYCYDCHGEGVSKGDLDLEDFPDISSMQADREQWKRIRTHIEQRLMPPLDEALPTDREREQLLSWIDAAVFPVDPEQPDPGRVTLRRLNRTEYENTLRDLLGVPLKVKSLLPPDDSGYGFDNIGDVLTLSPAHLEKLLETARISLDQALHLEPMPYPSRRIPGRELAGAGQSSDIGHFLHTNGPASASHFFEDPGEYEITVTASGTKGLGIGPNMELQLDGELIESWRVENPPQRPARYSTKIRLEKTGKKQLSAFFTNDFYDRSLPVEKGRDRNLLIHRIRVTGPMDQPRPPRPESHRRIFLKRNSGENDHAYASRVLQRFARRAFRRPLLDGEIDRYLHFLKVARENGDGAHHGIRLALEAMLVSPAFLFREEPQPEPDDPSRIHLVDEHTLANRLSYFIWSTMPDRRLMDLADRGQLRSQLDSEIDRMLESPRSRQLVSHFTGQWLQLRDLPLTWPSKRHFPRWNNVLRGDMRRETEMLFAEMLRADLPLTTLLDADFTFVNDRLARHYGMTGVEGSKFRRVEVSDPARRGLLGHGSFLLVTSHPTHTSPVLRGKYVLENLLDTPPPPPPPNVPQLTPPSSHGKNLSLREQMERHREDPSCASCHALMDPIGFGLEGFSAVGERRTRENGKPINDRGQLASGEEFAGAAELREILVRNHREKLYRSVASKMLTYALGRGTDWYDKPAIDSIVEQCNRPDSGTRSLVRAVIHSTPFQYRRGDG